MPVAALYDIHGNLPALEVVLEEVRQAAVDEVVVGGDVFPGPMSADVLDALLDLDLPVRFIQGNGGCIGQSQAQSMLRCFMMSATSTYWYSPRSIRFWRICAKAQMIRVFSNILSDS